jgi:Zn-dependent protease with chaperone function
MYFSPALYRYPHEHLILGLTIILVLGVIALTVPATLCLSGVFVMVILVISYLTSQSQHQSLMSGAYRVTSETTPDLANLVTETANQLQVKDLDVFLLRDKVINAYTFGLTVPKTIVLFSALFETMDRDELKFIIGHEMGHIKLGHTWLNSLIGGMAGIPSSMSASFILVLAFRWWNRACELSADRAGLLLCGKPEKAISALVKLVAGNLEGSTNAVQRALISIENEQDGWFNDLTEVIATHPIIVHRIKQIRQYINTPEYKRLKTMQKNNQLKDDLVNE